MREKQRKGEKRVSKAFFEDPQSFVGWNSLSQELKFIYSTRATLGYKKKMRGFTEDPNEEISGNRIFWARRLPTRATTLKEVEILHTLVYFPL